MKKLIIGTSLILATLAATPSFAATRHMSAAPQPYAATDSYAAAESGLTVRGPAIIANGQYAGWDPDPTIRFQLLRDPPGGSGY
jgi:hypothetical protein